MFKVIVFILLTAISDPTFANMPLKVGVPFKVARIAAIVQYHDFMKTALKDAGFDMELVTIPTKTTIEMLADGDVDAISYDDKGDDKRRANIVSMSFPIIFTQAKIFYRLGLNNFSEKTLGHFHAAIPQNNLNIMREADRRHMKYSSANNPYHCIQMLLNKQADFCIAVDEVASSAIKSFEKADQKIKSLDNAFLENPIFMSFQKKYKKDLPKIEQAFKARLKGDLSAYPLVEKHLNKTP